MEERKTVAQILSPAKRPRKIFTFHDFVTTVRNYYMMVNPQVINFVHEYPLQDSKDFKDIHPPIITYHLARKLPSPMGRETELKPRIRTIQADPNNPQQKTTYFGHRFLYLCGFGIWESSWDKLNVLAEGFEQFMLDYTGVFKDLGVSEIIYSEGLEDNPKTSDWKTDLVSYHVFYEVYIEKSIDVMNQVIEKIDVTDITIKNNNIQ